MLIEKKNFMNHESVNFLMECYFFHKIKRFFLNVNHIFIKTPISYNGECKTVFSQLIASIQIKLQRSDNQKDNNFSQKIGRIP